MKRTNMKLPMYGLINLWLLRNRIDEIDDHIYELIRQRMACCALTIHYKNSAYDERRESQIMDRLRRKGMLENDVVEDVWEKLLLHGRRIQEQLDDEKTD